MPLNDSMTAVLLALMLCQVCYGMMWPTLGGGVMLAVTPTPEQMAQVNSNNTAYATALT